MAISEKYKSQKIEKEMQPTGEMGREEAVWETRPRLERTWNDGDRSEEIVAALRGFFLTHTLDPLTGEVYTVH